MDNLEVSSFKSHDYWPFPFIKSLVWTLWNSSTILTCWYFIPQGFLIVSPTPSEPPQDSSLVTVIASVFIIISVLGVLSALFTTRRGKEILKCVKTEKNPKYTDSQACLVNSSVWTHVFCLFVYIHCCIQDGCVLGWTHDRTPVMILYYLIASFIL